MMFAMEQIVPRIKESERKEERKSKKRE